MNSSNTEVVTNFDKIEKTREIDEILQLIQSSDTMELEEYLNQHDFDSETLSMVLLFAIKNSTLMSTWSEIVRIICEKLKRKQRKPIIVDQNGKIGFPLC